MTCQSNAAALDSLFIMYCVINKILFDYLKAHHQISPKPEMEQALMLLTSDVPSYNSPCLNVKVPDKPFRRWILDKDTSPMYSEHKQTLTYMSQNDDTEFYRNEEEFQWT